MKKKSFDRLIDYLDRIYPVAEMRNPFNYDLLKNLVDYAYREHGHSKGSARGIVCSIIPFVTEEELRPYLPDFDEWEPEVTT